MIPSYMWTFSIYTDATHAVLDLDVFDGFVRFAFTTLAKLTRALADRLNGPLRACAEVGPCVVHFVAWDRQL